MRRNDWRLLWTGNFPGLRASGLQSRKIRNFLNNRIDMEKNEQTMRLSEDPRFIEHVKKEIAKIRRHIHNFEEAAGKKGYHRKRDDWDRLCGESRREC